jgi:uncharacterized protein YndB with AHSA1/START domain
MTKTLPDIQHEIVMNVSLARAWKVMTEPDYVARWLGCLEYRKAVGHVFYMQPDQAKSRNGDIAGATHCEILALDEPSAFRFSWYLPGFPKTEVEFRLKDVGASKTKVVFAHTGWDQFNAADIRQIWEGLSGGWTTAVLPGLKRVAEAKD